MKDEIFDNRIRHCSADRANLCRDLMRFNTRERVRTSPYLKVGIDSEAAHAMRFRFFHGPNTPNTQVGGEKNAELAFGHLTVTGRWS